MSRERLLLDEHPLVLLPGLARRLGINGALLLQQIHYLSLLPGGVDDIDGNHWTWQPAGKLREALGCAIDDSTIRRTLRKLEATGMLIVEWMSNLDDHWDRRNRTKAYRIDLEAVSEISGKTVKPAKNKMQIAQVQHGKSPSCKSAKHTVDISTENTGNRLQAKKAAAPRSRGADGAAAGDEQQVETKKRRRRASGIITYLRSDAPEAVRIEATYDPAEIAAGTTAARSRLNRRGNPTEPTPGVVEREILHVRAAGEATKLAKTREESGPVAEARARRQKLDEPHARAAADAAAAAAIAKLGRVLGGRT